MRYLLDTCVLSEFLKKIPVMKVIQWVDNESEDSQFISVLTIGEIRKGISRLSASRRKTELNQWFDSVIVRYDGRILDFNLDTANIWADMITILETKGRPLPIIDSLLAATALEHSLTLITRNEDDFTNTGAKVLNIWN